MIDILVLIAVLFLGLGLGGVALAVFFFAIEKLQAYGRERND